VLAGLDEVQKTFGDRFPNLLVPHAQEGRAVALQPYHLKNEALEESLAIALNQATYISFAYPGYPHFVKNALEILSTTLKLLGVLQLQRVAYRYENEIAVERRADGTLPIEEVLELPIDARARGDGLFDISFESRRKWIHGSFITRLAVDDDADSDLVRLTLVAIIEPAGSVEQLAAYAKSTHDFAYEQFESLITKDFREYIRQPKTGDAP